MAGMTDEKRREDIEGRLVAYRSQKPATDSVADWYIRDTAWLLTELHLIERYPIAERLRGLLARLEWSCHYECPACKGREAHGGHEPDCWLARELPGSQGAP